MKRLWGLTPDSSPCPCPHPRRLLPPPLPSPATGQGLLPSALPKGSWMESRETVTWRITSTWPKWVDCLLHSCKYRHWQTHRQTVTISRLTTEGCFQCNMFGKTITCENDNLPLTYNHRRKVVGFFFYVFHVSVGRVFHLVKAAHTGLLKRPSLDSRLLCPAEPAPLCSVYSHRPSEQLKDDWITKRSHIPTSRDSRVSWWIWMVEGVFLSSYHYRDDQ